MIGDLITLPLRLWVRSAMAVTRAAFGVTERAVSLAGQAIQTVTPGGSNGNASYAPPAPSVRTEEPEFDQAGEGDEAYAEEEWGEEEAEEEAEAVLEAEEEAVAEAEEEAVAEAEEEWAEEEAQEEAVVEAVLEAEEEAVAEAEEEAVAESEDEAVAEAEDEDVAEEEHPPTARAEPPTDPRREVVDVPVPAPEPLLQGPPAEREESGPAAAQAPPPDDEPAHVSEEPELVREEAERGAEEGAGAAVTVLEPWEGYAQMSAKDVIARAQSASAAELAAVRLYESSHRGRQSVLEAVDRQLKLVNGSGRPA